MQQHKFQEALDSKGWTQRQLSVAVGKPESHINLIIRGKAKPRVDLAIKIASVLGVSVEALFCAPAISRKKVTA